MELTCERVKGNRAQNTQQNNFQQLRVFTCLVVSYHFGYVLDIYDKPKQENDELC